MMEYVHETYGVPAKRGGRVVYHGEGHPRTGTITAASNGRLMIRLDGDRSSDSYHPTWSLEYLDAGGRVVWPASDEEAT